MEGTRTDTVYVGRDSPVPIATDAQAVLSTFSGQSDNLFKLCIFLQLRLFYSVFDMSPHALQMKGRYKCLLPIYVFPEVKLNCTASLFPKQPKQYYNVLSPNFHIHVSVTDPWKI